MNYHFRNYAGVHVVHARVTKDSLGRWDVFIDDKPETIEGFVERTDALVLAPRRPWNRHIKNIDVGRVEVTKTVAFRHFRNWSEVPGLIKDFA